MIFRDPSSFHAGELHRHYPAWERLVSGDPSPQQAQVLTWIRHRVAVCDYFQPFCGTFKGERYNSLRPPPKQIKNNNMCKPFVSYISQTLLARLNTGAIKVLGKVGLVDPPYLVLPLTIEPKKPRLCYDARFLNLWMRDVPFSLDTLSDLPRYVGRDSYQTVLDDKSGYDHVLLSEDSWTYFGFEWSGWYFLYVSLPFGWKISPFVYHSIGLFSSNYFRSIGIPCSLYIDDRHNGQLQVSFQSGAYSSLPTADARRFAAANSAIFLVAYHLVSMGYFLALNKSILVPRKTVPYLGFFVASEQEAFTVIPEKKEKFLVLLRHTLKGKSVTVHQLQRLVGKCISFSRAIPGALLFTRAMNMAISRGIRSGKPVPLSQDIRDELNHWLHLDSWDDVLPWRDEKHIQVALASDASGSGWGGLLLTQPENPVSGYWTPQERQLDISTREALALEKVISSFSNSLRNARVDAHVDNQAVVNAWKNQSGRSPTLLRAIKSLFFTVTSFNIYLNLLFVPSAQNPADVSSRRLSRSDSTLHPAVWCKVQSEFGGPTGHSCDLMALDSNVMHDLDGKPLPHFTPHPSPHSSGVNIFSQDLLSKHFCVTRCYVFSPLALVGPLLRYMRAYQKPFTLVVLDVYPKRYWWALLLRYARRSIKLASSGDDSALLQPSHQGWVPLVLPFDLWAFDIDFLVL